MSDQNEILGKIMRYCAYQDRSESEVRTKIASLKTSDENIEEIIQRLKREKFIDDPRFAENYVRGKLRLKGWGKLKLRNQLFLKGISSPIINQAINAISEEEYLTTFYDNIEKWCRTNPIEDQDLTKLYRFLESKGFERDLIFRHTKTYINNRKS